MARKKLSYEDLLEKVKTNLAPSLSEDWPELPVVKAEGVYLYTEDGREYMDFTSGIGVTNLGHNHPKILNAAIDQMKKFSHSAVGITLHEPLLRLTEVLPTVMPEGMEMFFFGNSGSEAVEGAMKLARYVSGRPGIIAFTGSFHGRTYGAASITSVKSKYRNHYEPFVSGVYFAEFANPYRCPIGDTPEKQLNGALPPLKRFSTITSRHQKLRRFLWNRFRERVVIFFRPMNSLKNCVEFVMNITFFSFLMKFNLALGGQAKCLWLKPMASGRI